MPPVSWIVEQTSPYHLLQVLTGLLVGLGLLLMIKRWRSSKEVLLPLTLSIGLVPLFLTWFATKTDWAQEVVGATTATMGYVGLSLIAAYCLETLYKQNWTLPKRLPLRDPWVGMLLVALILSPYVYYRVQDDPQLLRANYRLYAVTQEDDLRLMEWISEETDPEAVILANAFEPGMFIPSVAQRKIVFAYTGSQNSLSYQSLVHDIHEGKLDKTSFDTMKRFGVTHLYIGSRASWWWSVSAAFVGDQRIDFLEYSLG